MDRAKRVALIGGVNPTWDDLSEEWGKPIARLRVSASERKADPSLRS